MKVLKITIAILLLGFMLFSVNHIHNLIKDCNDQPELNINCSSPYFKSN